MHEELADEGGQQNEMHEQHEVELVDLAEQDHAAEDGGDERDEHEREAEHGAQVDDEQEGDEHDRLDAEQDERGERGRQLGLLLHVDVDDRVDDELVATEAELGVRQPVELTLRLQLGMVAEEVQVVDVDAAGRDGERGLGLEDDVVAQQVRVGDDEVEGLVEGFFRVLLLVTRWFTFVFVFL